MGVSSAIVFSSSFLSSRRQSSLLQLQGFSLSGGSEFRSYHCAYSDRITFSYFACTVSSFIT